MLVKLGLEKGEAIIHPWINKAVEKAQTKVEARNFEIRKQLLKYDDVMNDQRRVIFDQRKDIMRSENVHDTVVDMRHEAAALIVERAIPQTAITTSGLLNNCTMMPSVFWELMHRLQIGLPKTGLQKLKLKSVLSPRLTIAWLKKRYGWPYYANGRKIAIAAGFRPAVERTSIQP